MALSIISALTWFKKQHTPNTVVFRSVHDELCVNPFKFTDGCESRIIFFLGIPKPQDLPCWRLAKAAVLAKFFHKENDIFWSGEYYVHNMYLLCMFVIATSDSSLYSMVFIHIKFACNMTFNCWINHQLITSGKMINSQDWWKETTIILKWSLDILSLGITTENSEILLIRLLMDEFLHHLKGKHVKNEINYQPQLVSWISSIYSIVYLAKKLFQPIYFSIPCCRHVSKLRCITGVLGGHSKKRGRIFIRSEYLVAPTANNKKCLFIFKNGSSCFIKTVFDVGHVDLLFVIMSYLCYPWLS